MFKRASKFLVMAVMAGTIAVTPSCSDFAIGLTAGAIAVGVGAAIIGGHHHHGYCRGGYVEDCTTWRDYYNNRRTQCRDVYDPCLYRSSLTAGVSVKPGSISPEVAAIASNLSVSFDAADTLYSSVASVASGDMTAIGKIGLSKEDMTRLARGLTITNEGLELLSKSLNLEPTQTAQMVQKIALDMYRQRRDVSSAYWKACLSAGQQAGWRTDVVGGICTDVNVQGCSPTSGATACILDL